MINDIKKSIKNKAIKDFKTMYDCH